MAELQRAAADDDHHELARLAHRLGGTAGMLDQPRLAEVLGELERAAEGQGFLVPALLSSVERAAEQAREELALLCRRLDSNN